MERFINNELNTISNEKSNEINKFMKELQFELDDKKSKITIDKSLYEKIYNELDLAPKYKKQLENIIKYCMLDYSYDTDFCYLNYDERKKKYYMDYYDGDVTKTCLTKNDIKEGDYTVGEFYFITSDEEHLLEADYVKDIIKGRVEDKLNELEKGNEDGK